MHSNSLALSTKSTPICQSARVERFDDRILAFKNQRYSYVWWVVVGVIQIQPRHRTINYMESEIVDV